MSGPGAAGVKGLYISKIGQDNFASYPIYNSGNNNSDIPPGHMSYPIWLPAGNYDVVFEVPTTLIIIVQYILLLQELNSICSLDA